jgi:hypothetical protein
MVVFQRDLAELFPLGNTATEHGMTRAYLKDKKVDLSQWTGTVMDAFEEVVMDAASEVLEAAVEEGAQVLFRSPYEKGVSRTAVSIGIMIGGDEDHLPEFTVDLKDVVATHIEYCLDSEEPEKLVAIREGLLEMVAMIDKAIK